MNSRIICLLLCVLLLSPPALAQISEPYRVLVMLPLTGRSASVGVPISNGIALALEGIPAAKRSSIEVIVEDEQSSAQKAVSIYQQRALGAGFDAVVVFGSGIGNPIAPLAERDKKILLALVSADENVWRNRKYVFSHWMPIQNELTTMLDEIRARGYQRIAMISHEQEGINALDAMFESTLERASLSHLVVSKEKFLIENNDFRPALLKAKARKADGVYMVLLTGFATFAKQAREIHLDSELFGLHPMNNDSERLAADGALTGTWFVTANEPDDFTTRYQRRFNSPPGMGVINAYDSLMLLSEAAQKTHNDNAAVANFLNTLKDYHGAAGTYSADGDHRFTIPVAVRKITRDGFETIKH